jgi:hypothetical protein
MPALPILRCPLDIKPLFLRARADMADHLEHDDRHRAIRLTRSFSERRLQLMFDEFQRQSGQQLGGAVTRTILVIRAPRRHSYCFCKSKATRETNGVTTRQQQRALVRRDLGNAFTGMRCRPDWKAVESREAKRG